MQFDDVLIQLGQFGKYQRLMYFLLCIPGILCAFHQLAAVFLSATPDYRCGLPKTVYNVTDTYKIQDEFHRSAVMEYISINKTTANASTDLSLDILEKCETFNGDKCSSYVYSQEEITKSVVTEWDLVCVKKIYSTVSSSVYMAGVLVGSLVFGLLSDVIGRKKTMLVCLLMQGASGLGCAFSQSYYPYVVLRFITGSASMGLFMTMFVLGMELIGPKYRLAAGIIIEYFFALGYVLLTGIAYLTRDWKYTQIAISAPSFIFLSYYWVTPESARWLLGKGRVSEAEEIVQKAAKFNGVELPKDVLQSLDKQHGNERLWAVLKAPTLRNRSLVLFFNWCVISMGYYGLSLNSGSLGGSIYLNFMLGGLVEFPALTLCFGCNRFGRKWPHVGGMMIGGLACLGTVFVDLYARGLKEETLTIYFVTLNMIGKFGMTIGFCLIYIWSAELYPTSLRNSLMGISSMFARAGSIAAPFIADLGDFVPEKYKRILPASIFGSLVLVGGLMSIILPDTTGISLADTIEEADSFPKHDRDKFGQPITQSKVELISNKESETKFNQ